MFLENAYIYYFAFGIKYYSSQVFIKRFTGKDEGNNKYVEKFKLSRRFEKQSFANMIIVVFISIYPR